jgi:hypothetical protein
MSLRKDDNGNVMQVGRLGASQDLTITASSQQSAAFTTLGVFAVRVVATVDCRIAIGSNPTATTTSTLLLAGTPEYFAVAPGEKLAVIGTSGILNVTGIA